MPDKSRAAVCGLFCPGCRIYIAHRESPEGRERIARAAGRSAAELVCDGCRSDRRFSFCDTCKIYACAAEKGLDFCGACEDFPCADLRAFQAARPHRIELWAAQERIREAGWEVWFAEMLERYACPACGTLNSAYDAACRACGATPANAYVAAHQETIHTYVAHVRGAREDTSGEKS